VLQNVVMDEIIKRKDAWHGNFCREASAILKIWPNIAKGSLSRKSLIEYRLEEIILKIAFDPCDF